MASDIPDRIMDDLKTAMKGKDTARTTVLRGLKSDFKYREIDKGAPLDESDYQQVLRTAQKKRRDAIEMYQRGDRADLVAKEEGELAIISEYLPKEMPDDQLAALVQAVIDEVGASAPNELGKVMGPAMKKVAGRAAGDRVRQTVADQLAVKAGGD
ncbi:MAG: GatB/YqeY domain-containing protein [candidate division Zixibacteria bacterium]|nr:GatB/YqeY domain-containing protein [candidate division Zixibacteria bacterium]